MKKSKRILAALLSLVLMLSCFPILTIVETSAASSVTLAQLQAKYPHGKYWNGGNANSYTSKPCTHHGNCSYNGSCGCNSFKGHAIQCMGFAYQLAYLVYGGDPYVDRKPNKNTSALNSLKAGDVVRYKNNKHSIFVTGVNGNTVTYADCNSDEHCIIRWNQQISKSTLKNTFSYVDPAPYAWNSVSHTVNSNYSKNFTAYPKNKITASNIFDANHVQISSTAWIGTKDKCTISEVYTDGCCKVTYPIDGGGKKTVYSKISLFNIAKYTISYNANGGTGAPSKQTKTDGTALTLSSTKPTKTGYTFLGWAEKSSATSAQYQPKGKFTKEADMTLYAVWRANKLSVYYNTNGGKITSDTYKQSGNDIYVKSTNKKYEHIWTYNEKKANGLTNAASFGLARSGYTFKGWGTTASGGTIYDQKDNTLVPTKLNSNITKGNCSTTLYAIWTANTYKITYNANGGTGAPAQQTKTHDKNLTLSNIKPVWAGYEFLGWAEKSSADSAQYQPGQTYKANKAVTLYAVWKRSKVEVTKVELNQETAQLEVGDTLDLIATISPNNATNKTVTWKTDRASVATVENGKVTAVGEGTAKITAEASNGKSAICTVTVQNKDVPQPDAPVFKLSPSNITARPGGEFTVDLSLNNNPGITSLSLVLDFPTDALTLTKVEYKNLFSSPASGTDKLSSPFYISWFSQLSKDENSNGIIATLTFKVKDEAKKDTYPIGISYDENNVFDSSFTNVKFETKNAQISVSESIPGDVNGDNTVNMKDIVILQQYLNKMSVSINQGNADVNGDNTVNMKDVVLLQQYLNNWDVKLK